jgi:hypothetical protein
MKNPGALIASLALLSGLAVAGEISFDFALDQDAFEVTTFEGGDALYWPNGQTCMEEGLPDLPGTGFCFVIPQGTTAASATVEILSETTLDGLYDILPVRMTTVSAVPGPFTRDPSVYLSDEDYPGSPVISVTNGNRTGFRLATVSFTPFRYNPISGHLSVITSARLTLHYSDDPQVPILTLTPGQIQLAEQVVESFVRNPESLASCRPAERARGEGTDWGTWVAIGSSAKQATVQPLVDHRNASGMTAEYVTTEWIYANYTGYDTQEKIRNYLKDAYENHGLQYALIIGDWGETQRISKLNTGGATLNETADLYYSDLDGTWDADGDHLYGENTDGLDYYSDIAVGRFSTDVLACVDTQVDKTIIYETTAPSGAWRTRALVCGAGLWPEYGYFGSIVCDSICNNIPPSWTEYKLYETPGGSHPTNQIEVVNSGVSYVGPQGHGYSSGVYWYYSPTNMFTNSNYTGMTNWGMFPVFHSIACLAGQLSNPACMAERLMYWTNGGAVAVMFNSNNGYGAPPSMGPSEKLEIHFAHQLWTMGFYRLGVAQAAGKDAFKASGGMSMQNWVLQENNMLGDPAVYFAPYQTGIGDQGGAGSPMSPVLAPAWPNPTSGSFSIAWSMPSAGAMTLGVYDVTGRLVRSVEQPQASAVGIYAFDGMDDLGAPLTPGCYFVRLSAASGTARTSVVVLGR